MNTAAIFLILINFNHFSPLVLEETLVQMAETRAEYLCEQNQWSHDGLIEMGHQVDGILGENLARGFSGDALRTYFAFLASPSHKEIMTRTYFTKLGYGYSSECDITVLLFN